MEPARPSQLRVFLVDDHRVVAHALARMVDAEPDMTVVGTALSVRELEHELGDDVDCALISYLLRDGTAADATRLVKRRVPYARVVVMSRIHDRHAHARVANAGADAFLDGHASSEDMLAALRGKTNGTLAAPPASRSRRRRRRATGGDNGAHPLTPRELDVLQRLALGRTTRQICAELGIGNNTVRTHVQNVIAKLHVHSRLEAVTLANREHII